MRGVPRVSDRRVPALTAEQMLEVDRLMVDEYKIELVQMMELAGRNLARLASRLVLRAEGDAVVGVMAGRGGNGGGALVCARHLYNQGADVRVYLSRPPEDYSGVPAHQLGILRRLGVRVAVGPPAADDPGAHEIDLLVDGVIGYSLRGAPRGTAAELISWSQRADVPVLALDVPSGIDATTGAAGEPAVEATATMTLALPKTGLAAIAAAASVGALYLADIGVPPEVYERIGVDLPDGPIFAADALVALEAAEPSDSTPPYFRSRACFEEEPHG